MSLESLSKTFHDLRYIPWLSTTYIIFHDFPGLEKMVLLNSMTSHDRATPCILKQMTNDTIPYHLGRHSLDFATNDAEAN